MATTPKKKKTAKKTPAKKTSTPAKKTTQVTKQTRARKPAAKMESASLAATVEPLTPPAETLQVTPQTQADLNRIKAEQEVQKIRESAQRLGIELDEDEAIQWLTQMAAQDKTSLKRDDVNSIYGAKVVILDFSTQDLEYFRTIGKIVAIPDQPGVVETALALSGSAAQNRIQKNPGDADYFQRVNIKADTREQATKILADAMREKGQSTMHAANFHLLAVKFGTHAQAATRNGKPIKKGAPMTWYPKDLLAGAFDVQLEDGSTKTIQWQDGMLDPGWTKLDWVVADSERGTLANASNLLDVTWEAPNGEIIPLDGVIDPYFQEVYLDAGSFSIFNKLAEKVSEDALGKYVSDLEHEVYKYLVKHINYGKVAKRAYNVFRVTDRTVQAAYIRELFDEPNTALYRVWSLLETLSGVDTPESKIDRTALLNQYDKLIEQVIQSTEGEREIRIVRALMRARDKALGLQPMTESVEGTFEVPREDVMDLLNDYFHGLLYGFEPVAAYLEEIRARNYEKKNGAV